MQSLDGWNHLEGQSTAYFDEEECQKEVFRAPEATTRAADEEGEQLNSPVALFGTVQFRG